MRQSKAHFHIRQSPRNQSRPLACIVSLNIQNVKKTSKTLPYRSFRLYLGKSKTFKAHAYVAMLRRILTQYPHAEFVFQFAPDGILSFYGEFLPDIKGIAAEMCWCVIDCDTDGYIQTGTACHTMIGVEITCRQTRTGW